MKKALIAFALVAVASTAQALISGGAHDMNFSQGGALGACQYCHAPHNGNTGIPGAPLWNRTAPAGTLTLYSSPTLSAPIAALGANSLTCLSCHDGVTDLGATFTGTSETLGNMTGSYADLTTDLRNDHPVGVGYTVGASFQAVATVTGAGLDLYDYGAGNTVQCGSCHDPHLGTDGLAGGAALLKTAVGVDICLACHIK